MKTWKNVALASAVVVVALSFSIAAAADCKKSRSKRADPKSQMQGMDMGEEMSHGCMMDMGEMEMEGGSDTSDPAPAESAGPQKVVDPVCGMTVDPETAEKSMYQGKAHYFCSKEDGSRLVKTRKGDDHVEIVVAQDATVAVDCSTVAIWMLG